MPKLRSRILVWTLTALVAAGGLWSAASAFQASGQGPTVQAPKFEVDPMWPKPLPNHWILGSAVGVAVDSRDHVFVVHLTDSFNTRTEIGAAQDPPTGECCIPAPNVLEFDAEGNLVGHWGGPGQGFEWPAENHGISIDPDGNVWIAGSGGTDTRLLKFTRDGRFLAEIGKKVPVPAPAERAAADTSYQGVAPGRAAGRGGRGGGRGGRGAPPPTAPPNSASMESFGGAAEITFDASTGEGFVADGYRNRRVAVIDFKTGAIKRIWGAFGNAPQDQGNAARQFGTPVHCAELANDGHVYVCDRANNRIQVFRKDGAFVKEKVIAPETRGSGSVWDIAFSRDPQQRFLYVADGSNMKVHIVDRQSLEVLSSFGTGGRQPGQFFAVHSIATDSRGNVYTTETLQGKRVQKFLFRGVQAVPRNQGVVWPSR
ncbi:MAG TPA: hypothetical protein VF178_15400 [Gemmatimonadaceae bacterium]